MLRLTLSLIHSVKVLSILSSSYMQRELTTVMLTNESLLHSVTNILNS